MKRIAESLENTYYIDIKKFDDAINTIKSICTIIPYTESMHKNAYLITLDKRYDLEDPDASIYASIKEFASMEEVKNYELLFLTKNWRDFDKTIIKNELNNLRVKMFFSTGECIRWIKNLI
ncbi:MAG TPA: hypothetical protein EYP22_02415 [Methanosarcinales archaeon]|nr:hypothetical protein [Methanosarcinales archaeon]